MHGFDSAKARTLGAEIFKTYMQWKKMEQGRAHRIRKADLFVKGRISESVPERVPGGTWNISQEFSLSLSLYQRKFSGKLPIYELLGSLTGIVVLVVVVLVVVVVAVVVLVVVVLVVVVLVVVVLVVVVVVVVLVVVVVAVVVLVVVVLVVVVLVVVVVVVVLVVVVVAVVVLVVVVQ